jgi:hypothetical protein
MMTSAVETSGTATVERWLTKDEASKALAKHGIKIAPKTLGEQGRLKKLPSAKLNGLRRYRLSELLKHYEQVARGAED